jgi:predicted metal-dependent phosphoesterase TrpH
LNTDGKHGELHILGYGFDSNNQKLGNYVNWRKQERMLWSKRIIAKLQKLGYKVDWETCWQRAREEVIVRTHIADELVESGYFYVQRSVSYLIKKRKACFY